MQQETRITQERIVLSEKGQTKREIEEKTDEDPG